MVTIKITEFELREAITNWLSEYHSLCLPEKIEWKFEALVVGEKTGYVKVEDLNLEFKVIADHFSQGPYR